MRWYSMFESQLWSFLSFSDDSDIHISHVYKDPFRSLDFDYNKGRFMDETDINKCKCNEFIKELFR